jgi:NTE family protein
MLEALEARGVRPDLIVGTSAGSLIGALFSHFGATVGLIGRIEEVIASEEFAAFEKKYFGEREAPDGHARRGIRHFFSSLADGVRMKMHVGMSIFTSAMIAEDDVTKLYEKMFEGVSYDTLKFPFAAVAVDLSEGAPAVFTDIRGHEDSAVSRTIEGREGVMRAVMASCAIPLVFPAVEIGGHAFADGSVMANLPIREARALLPNRSLLLAAFDVQPPVPQFEDKLSSLELALRLLDLATRSKQYADRELADIVFMPLEADYPWSSFSEYKSFIELGRAYMTEERLDAFESAFAEKCLAESRKAPNFLRALAASARIRRIMRRSRSG